MFKIISILYRIIFSIAIIGGFFYGIYYLISNASSSFCKTENTEVELAEASEITQSSMDVESPEKEDKQFENQQETDSVAEIVQEEDLVVGKGRLIAFHELSIDPEGSLYKISSLTLSKLKGIYGDVNVRQLTKISSLRQCYYYVKTPGDNEVGTNCHFVCVDFSNQTISTHNTRFINLEDAKPSSSSDMIICIGSNSDKTIYSVCLFDPYQLDFTDDIQCSEAKFVDDIIVINENGLSKKMDLNFSFIEDESKEPNNNGNSTTVERNDSQTSSKKSKEKVKKTDAAVSPIVKEITKTKISSSYIVSGRRLIGCSNPRFDGNAKGKINVGIIVDRDGKVINAHLTSNTTDISDINTINAFVEAAKHSRFSSVRERKNQEGTVSFILTEVKETVTVTND